MALFDRYKSLLTHTLAHPKNFGMASLRAIALSPALRPSVNDVAVLNIISQLYSLNAPFSGACPLPLWKCPSSPYIRAFFLNKYQRINRATNCIVGRQHAVHESHDAIEVDVAGYTTMYQGLRRATGSSSRVAITHQIILSERGLIWIRTKSKIHGLWGCKREKNVRMWTDCGYKIKVAADIMNNLSFRLIQ